MSSKTSARIIGASNVLKTTRAHKDYYATEPKAIDALMSFSKLRFKEYIWECACGEGHLSKRLKELGYKVWSTDLIYRGYGEKNPLDFLKATESDYDVITNPPYEKKLARQFAEHALEICNVGCKIAMFVRLNFLESKDRRELFDKHPPKYVLVCSSRIMCAKNGDFVGLAETGGVTAYCWVVWEKGYSGPTELAWIN